jgi:hypothetical protein
MTIREYLRNRKQRKARKRYEREKELRDRQRSGLGPDDVAEKVKDGMGFPTGGTSGG